MTSCVIISNCIPKSLYIHTTGPLGANIECTKLAISDCSLSTSTCRFNYLRNFSTQNLSQISTRK